jgi:Zn-dependent peptidase ImmA (M78 family)/transcriptional regulator with XRE-family HTH domain
VKTGIPGFYGERLRQAREAFGLSQTSLADMVKVSKQAVSQYERGADSPGPAVFDRIREVLDHEAHFFLRPPLAFEQSTRFYRSMASATKTARLRAEARLLWMRELLRYVGNFIEFPKVNFPELVDPSCDPSRLSMDAIEAAAQDLRKHWKLGDGPIPNLTEAAEANGAIVVRHELDSAALDALSEWLRPEQLPLVVLNSDKRVAARSRLDLGHELGHLLLHRHVAPEYLTDPERFDLIESQAFRFGAALLLPERPFLDDLYSVSLDALRSIKLRWKVSIAMMIERLKDLGIVDQDQYRRLRINYSTRKWNREEPYDKESPVEQPSLLVSAIRLVSAKQIQSIDQISAATGFRRNWIDKLLALPSQLDVQLNVKILEFKRA